MGNKQELLRQLRAADQSLKEEQLRPTAIYRIGNRLTQELERNTSRRRWLPMATFVAGAALVLLVVAWGSMREAAAPPTQPAVASAPPVAILQATVSGPSCEYTRNEQLSVRGACRVVVDKPRMKIQTLERTALDLRSAHGLELHRGEALFDVDPRPHEPLEIRVPGGALVVIGTRFRLVVDPAGGQVDLYEGKLKFVGADGRESSVEAGQRFHFDVPKPKSRPPAMTPVTETQGVPPTNGEVAPPTTTASPKPSQPIRQTQPTRRKDSKARRADLEAIDVSEVVRRVKLLRSRGEYSRAAATLRTALQTPWDRRTRQVLSYELGTILGRHLGDKDSACGHWNRHLKEFPNSRYRAQIRRSRDTLGCTTKP